NKTARGAAEQDRLQPSRSTDTARHFNDVSNGRAKRDFIHTWPNYVPGKAEQPVAGRICRADARVGRTAVQNDLQDVDQRLDVVDDAWLVEQSALCGKRRIDLRAKRRQDRKSTRLNSSH